MSAMLILLSSRGPPTRKHPTNSDRPEEQRRKRRQRTRPTGPARPNPTPKHSPRPKNQLRRQSRHASSSESKFNPHHGVSRTETGSYDCQCVSDAPQTRAGVLFLEDHREQPVGCTDTRLDIQTGTSSSGEFVFWDFVATWGTTVE